MKKGAAGGPAPSAANLKQPWPRIGEAVGVGGGGGVGGWGDVGRWGVGVGVVGLGVGGGVA